MGQFTTVDPRHVQAQSPQKTKSTPESSGEAGSVMQGKHMAPPPFSLSSYPLGLGGFGFSPYGPLLGGQEMKGATSAMAGPLTAGNQYLANGDLAKWEDFAGEFNEKFKSVLHVFAPEGTAEVHVGKGTASGKVLTGQQLQALFTDKQRTQLLDFFQTNQIPERLFNGDEQGGATAPQRILLSAEILANGVYAPGSFEQRVHAKNCGHWVQTVQNYAGVTANSGANSDSLNGNFDLQGNVIMGADMGRPEGYTGKRVSIDQLPSQESERIGPIYENTAHGIEAAKRAQRVAEMEAAAAQAEEAGKEAGKKSKKPITPFRCEHLPFDQFGLVQPGDWLYIYNANGSGNHSVIFSRWASEEKEIDGVRYRKAVTFDQNSPKDGGEEHLLNLGQQFHSTGEIKISPITLVSKVNPEARPAETIDELLPTYGSKEGLIEEKNLKFIQSIEKKQGGKVNQELLFQLLAKENSDHIAFLGDRLTDGQRKLLEAANSTQDLETLVRLTQRLRQLHENAVLLAENQTKIYESKLNGQYDELIAAYEAKEAEVNTVLEPLYQEKGPWEEALIALTEQKDALDTSSELKRARKRLKQVKEELEGMKKNDPAYAKKKEERNQILADIEDFKQQGRENKEEIGSLRSQINELKRKIAKVNAKIAKQENILEEAALLLPYGQVAGGSTKNQDKSSRKAGANGELADVVSKEALKKLVEQEAY